MKRKARIAVWVGALIVVFAGGWIGGTLWSVHRLSRLDVAHLTAQLWIGQISDLMAHFDGTLLHGDKVPTAVGSNLDSMSMGLSYYYDDLSDFEKGSIAQYLKAARKIVATQSGKGLMRDRSHLAIFIDCVEQSESTGRPVRACARRRGMYSPPSSVHPSQPNPGRSTSAASLLSSEG
jgi:hypothetical protein